MQEQQKRPTRITTTFRLTGDDVQPDVITHELGIAPTRSWRKGDTRMMTKQGSLRYTFGCWALESASSKMASLEHQIATLLDTLEALPSSLHGFIETFYAEVSVGYSTDESNFGFNLDATTIQRLNNLKLNLDISIYAVGVETESSSDDAVSDGTK